MPFMIEQREIVVIDRAGVPDVSHAFDHDGKNSLVTQWIAGDALEFDDAKGSHAYAGRSVIGLHFRTVPDYTNARVHLWQDGFGIPSADGQGRLYLIDLGNPEVAYPIRTEWCAAGMTFAQLAARLVEGTARLEHVAHNPVDIDTLENAALVATWYHQPHKLTVHTETRGGVRVPVAGQVAVKFLGSEAMDAADRRP
jgi:hypothetical protein